LGREKRRRIGLLINRKLKAISLGKAEHLFRKKKIRSSLFSGVEGGIKGPAPRERKFGNISPPKKKRGGFPSLSRSEEKLPHLVKEAMLLSPGGQRGQDPRITSKGGAPSPGERSLNRKKTLPPGRSFYLLPIKEGGGDPEEKQDFLYSSVRRRGRQLFTEGKRRHEE